MDPLPSTVCETTPATAIGRADAKTHVRGINFPWEGCNWASALSSSGRHPGFRYTYDETVVDRQKVTNLRLPGQYDERLLSSLGLQGPYYNWNRWYLPGVGRYLELDPLALKGKFNAPHVPDWYSYALDNPLRNTDPYGLAAPSVPGALVDIIMEWILKDFVNDWTLGNLLGAACASEICRNPNPRNPTQELNQCFMLIGRFNIPPDPWTMSCDRVCTSIVASDNWKRHCEGKECRTN